MCKRCKGYGFLGYRFYPGGGYRGGGGYLYDADACPDCFEKGICPVCSGNLPDNAACSCGWSEEKGKEQAFDALDRGEDC